VNPSPQRTIQSVDRALGLLRVLCDERAGLSLKELGRRLRLPVQTVQSLLRTLQAHGLVAQAGRGAPYVAGAGLASWVPAARSRAEQSALARPLVQALVNRLHESVLLAVLSGQSVLGLLFVQADRSLSVHSSQTFLNLHTMATGKVLLAALAEEPRAALVRALPLERATDHTVTDAETLLAQLERIREQGWAETIDEDVAGISAVAVPLPAPGPELAALGTCLPTARYSAARRASLVGELRTTAARLGEVWSGSPTGAGAGDGPPQTARM